MNKNVGTLIHTNKDSITEKYIYNKIRSQPGCNIPD